MSVWTVMTCCGDSTLKQLRLSTAMLQIRTDSKGKLSPIVEERKGKQIVLTVLDQLWQHNKQKKREVNNLFNQ
eukprot:2766250-Amphidinium_carterae.1